MQRYLRLFVLPALILCAFVRAEAQDAVELRLNLKAGESYPLHTSARHTTSQDILGEKQETTEETLFDSTWKAVEVAPDGIAKVLVTFDRIRMQQAGTAGGQSFDSAQTTGDNPLAKTLGVLASQSFTMRLAPDGRIVEVADAEGILKQMIEAARPADDEERKIIEEGLKAQWGPDGLREMFEDTTSIYPGKPVALGESWEREVATQHGFPLTVKSTYTLRSVENGAATIDVSSAIASTEAPATETGTRVPMKVKLSGRQTGTLVLDVATGWYREAKLARELSGTIEFEGGAGAPGMAMPLSMKSETSIAGVKP